MRFLIFCQSIVSDWNHGNAHFLRGIASDLLRRGHDLEILEPANSWSRRNLESEYGDAPALRFRAAYPELSSKQYSGSHDPVVDEALSRADVVLVHEWNEPEIVARAGQERAARPFTLLFHDTHHRSVTAPESMARYDLRHYDGVLAFGASVAEQYRRHKWASRVWVWHEAADTMRFRPLTHPDTEGDVIWVGNWGDDERTAELREFLLNPVRELGVKARIHGVRYPEEALQVLAESGVDYRGWAANFEVPRIFSRFTLTLHIPRRPYTKALPGVPTIRVFEALACGIPLISAPWSDSEGLFAPGRDFLVARNGDEMKTHMRALLSDTAMRREVTAHGLATIRARHTCTHRVDELLRVCSQITPAPAAEAVA